MSKSVLVRILEHEVAKDDIFFTRQREIRARVRVRDRVRGRIRGRDRVRARFRVRFMSPCSKNSD